MNLLMNIKTSIFLVLVLFSVILMGTGSSLSASDKESQFFARRYMSETEALRHQSRPMDRITPDYLTFNDTRLKRMRREQRVKVFTNRYEIFRIHRGETGPVYRYAVFIQQPGQHEFMDLMYGINTDGTVHRIDLLVYREPYGGEVGQRRFMKQFEGRTLNNSKFRINLDVIHIVGATISSHSVARGTRKVLALLRMKGLIP